MWNEFQLANDLREIGLSEGANVLAHVSLRAMGSLKEGAATLLRALRLVLGDEGTLLVPVFSRAHLDPVRNEALIEPEEAERLRAQIPAFDGGYAADVNLVGAFAEFVRRHPQAWRSRHPALSFAALGPQAEFLTRDVPFHYPLGSDTPLARLHQLNGFVLLIGMGQPANCSIHLAEIWAETPYAHRSATLKNEEGRWMRMMGSPECSEGFRKIDPLLRQSRISRQGYIGNAESQLMRQRALVSMAVAMLRGDPKSLLCDDPTCAFCAHARKLSGETY